MPVYGAALMYSPLTRSCRVKRPASLILTLARAFGILLTVAFGILLTVAFGILLTAAFSILLTVAFSILLTLPVAILLLVAPLRILLLVAPFAVALFVSHLLPPQISFFVRSGHGPMMRRPAIFYTRRQEYGILYANKEKYI